MDSQSRLEPRCDADDSTIIDNIIGDTQGGSSSEHANIKRSDFPEDFIFGCATSAYQVEGAWSKGGKGLSNWDVFTMRTPGKIDGGTNACTAIDQYHRIKEDVALMKKIGLDSYRFSIAWTRVLPGGRLSAGTNSEGIQYYNDLIDLLLAEGIKPCATIFHWDVPQCLEDEYGGFLSPRIIKDFCEFAEVCFWEFGDRVKHWITLNEPWSFAVSGYVLGIFPPGRGRTSLYPIIATAQHRSKSGSSSLSSQGNPAREPYTVAHHLILSHALAFDIYKKRYKNHQKGMIGMANVSQWFEPLTDTRDDKDAAERALDFMLGWFVMPLVTGDYPPVMRKYVKDNRLPCFTPKQAKLVKGSYDFLGINYYTAFYVSYERKRIGIPESYDTDQLLKLSSTDRNGNPIGPKGGSDWLNIVPCGIYKLLLYMTKTYNNPIIYVTENGVDEVNNTALTFSEARFDKTRLDYHIDHLYYVKKARDERVNVQGYYIWSMFDNFEWAAGYSVRFGIFYVDYMNGHLTRFPKASAIWFMNFMDKKPPTMRKLAKEEKEGSEEYGSVKRLTIE